MPTKYSRYFNRIWFTKSETASRVLQRISAVFDSAILRQTRERANPCTGLTHELGTKRRSVEHHAALPWCEVTEFVRDLRERQTQLSTRLALEFLILCASRSGEVRGAVWREIDIEARVWSIPVHDLITGQRRLKGEAPHLVPLSDQAIAILRQAQESHDRDLVFPSNSGKPISDNTFSKLMRDEGLAGTPHRFRSTFKDWCAEHGVRDEVSEAALGHADPNKVRAAYRRTRFFEERADLMRR
jgi:integrase